VDEADRDGGNSTAGNRIASSAWVTTRRVQNYSFNRTPWISLRNSKLQKPDYCCGFSARATWTHIMSIVKRYRDD